MERIAVNIQMDVIGIYYNRVRALQIIQRNSYKVMSPDGAQLIHPLQAATQIERVGIVTRVHLLLIG
jgi:hypothetical protein